MLPPSPSIFPVDEAAENSSNSECGEKCNKFDQKLNTFRQQSGGCGEGSGSGGGGRCSHRSQLTRQNASARQAVDELDGSEDSLGTGSHCGGRGGLQNRLRLWLGRRRFHRSSRSRGHCRRRSGGDSPGDVAGAAAAGGGKSSGGNKSYEFLQEVAAALECSHQQLQHQCDRRRRREHPRRLIKAAAATVRTRSLRRAVFACVAGSIVAFLIIGGCLIGLGHAWGHRPAITAGAILVICGGGLLLYSCCASTQYQSRRWNKDSAATSALAADAEPPCAESTAASPGRQLRLHQPPLGRPYLSMGTATVGSSRQGSLYSLAASTVPGEMRLCRGNSITDMMHDTVPACLQRHHHHHHRHRTLSATIPLPL